MSKRHLDRRQWLSLLAASAAMPLGLSACGGGGSEAGASAQGAEIEEDELRQAQEVAFLPTRTITIGAQKIAVYESKGTGPAVLLVHGNSSSSKIWQQTIQGAFGRSYRVVAFDLPGHGSSPAATAANRASTYSIPGYAAIIKGVVSQLGLANATIVGWSLGGHAVLEASPELTLANGFMIFGTPPLPYPPAADFGGAFLKIGLGFIKDWTPEQARQFVAEELSPGAVLPSFMLNDASVRTDGFARSTLGESIGTIGYRDEVKIVTTMKRPLAILQGGNEQIVNLAYLQAMAPTIPKLWNKKITVIPGAGHALQYEKAALFESQLSAFIAYAKTA